MKNMFISTKKIFIALLLVVSFLFLGNMAVFSSIYQANAYVYEAVSSSVDVENGDFTSYTRGNETAPYSLSNKNWKVTQSSGVIAGVIDVSDTTFSDNNKFGLSSNPKTDETITSADNYILMFRSEQLGMGSSVSDEFTFAKSKFYRLSVHVKTINNAIASLYLSADESKSFINVSTGGVWKTYSFYIATDNLNELDSTLTLCYGASKSMATTGAVFFDCVEIYETSNEDFYFANTSDITTKVIDKTRISTSPFLNSNFENGLTNWEVEPLTGNGQATVAVRTIDQINATLNSTYNNNGSKNYARTNVFGNTKELFILNNNVTTSTISSTINNMATIEQHSFYVLTFLLKTGETSGNGITVTLTPENSNDYEPLVVTGLTSSSGLNEYNGFEIKTIYIKGSVSTSQKFYITFSLPESSGYAIIDNISLTPLTQQEYADNVGSSKALDFSANSENTSTILNGNFFFTDNETINETYPIKPLNWTYSSDKNNVKSGVIRINPTLFSLDRENYGYPANPGVNLDYYKEILGINNLSTDENNFNESFLMIRNKTNNDATYTTNDSFTINANSSSSSSTVKISVGVKTYGTAKAFIKLIDKDGNIVAVIDEISSTTWKTYNIYIKNGLASLNLNVVLGVEGNGNDNFVFFDDVSYNSSSTDDLSKMISNNSFYLNLMEDSFYFHSNKVINDSYANNNFSNYSSTEGSGNYFGVKTTSTRTGSDNNKVLFVNNVIDGYQTLITNYSYSLTKNNYYEISVWVKTDFSGTSLNGENYGGYFEIVTLDSDGNIVETEEENKNKFSNIVVDSPDTEGWVKYSMYILCETSQNIKILLGMGTQEDLTQGKIYFDDLKVTDITKTEYVENVPSLTTIVSKTIEVSDEGEDTDNSTSSTEQESVNIWALVSSILLVAALLFALAGYAIRQIPKSKVKKVSKKNNYVIEIKKVKQKDIQDELKLKRQKDLSMLNEELSNVKKEYEILREKYENDTADKDEVESRVIYREYAISANKLLSRIEYLNSAIAFLNDPFNIRQTEKREISKRNKQNKKDFEMKMQEEYEKINDSEKSKNVIKKSKKK